jgi:hypothetical protein
MTDCSVMLLTVLRRQQYGTPVDYYPERMSKARFIVLNRRGNIMKKTLLVAVALVFALGLTACESIQKNIQPQSVDQIFHPYVG